MRYRSFQIRNFKGIKDTKVNLETTGGASVFPFVSLNESGKTTVLEAIHSFSPDPATSELLGGLEDTGIPYTERVPRHLISSFTGDVSVLAELSVTPSDKKAIVKMVEEKGLVIDISRFPDEGIFERQQRFKDGDFVMNFFSMRSCLYVKKVKQRKWREPSHAENIILRDAIYAHTPDISYFPTFVFEFPEQIFLTNRGGVIDKFYRRVFQDILDYDQRGHTIDKDIVRRVRSEALVVPWLDFLTFWMQHDDRQKIQHVMDRAGAVVTRVVFGRWNEIFGEETKGKEVYISFETAQGETKDSRGASIPTNEHDIFIKFQIRDGTRRFDVNDRSLGFRWFFAFMLFTQFRVARSTTRPLLFLFDEPASNLHAAAQQKLIDCFPEIGKGEHSLLYTTHSHYMIEPKWLEQTFIVTNQVDSPTISILDATSFDDESLDIKVSHYRTFVNNNPGRTSYFQPILDRLEVVPSRFDMKKASLVLEGRSDYYILRYAAKLMGIIDPPMLPGLGAGTFGALAALSVGWDLNFLFLLDGDRQGKFERHRYASEFGVSLDRAVTLDELIPGTKVIEDLLDDGALRVIQTSLKLVDLPNKGQVKRFFQERLASDTIGELGPHFRQKAEILLRELRTRLK